MGVDVDGSWRRGQRLDRIGNAEFARVTEDTRDGILEKLAIAPNLTLDQVEESVRQSAGRCGGDRGRAMSLGIVQARRRVAGR